MDALRRHEKIDDNGIRIHCIIEGDPGYAAMMQQDKKKRKSGRGTDSEFEDGMDLVHLSSGSGSGSEREMRAVR